MDHSIAGAERSIAGTEHRTPGMVRREGSRLKVCNDGSLRWQGLGAINLSSQ